MASPTNKSVATCAFSAEAESSTAKKPKILINDDVTGFYELSNDGLRKICSEKKSFEKSDVSGDMETDYSVEKNIEKITEVLNVAEEGELAPKAKNDKQESSILVKYPPNFKGEIFLLVDSSGCQAMNNDKITTGLTLLSQIKDLKVQDLDLIYAIGRSLYKVTFTNVYAANSFLLDNRIRKRGLKPFLPRSALETYGVVRGVPVCFSDYDILKNSRSAATIVSVMRFKRKDPAGDNYSPTTTIKIGFAGNDVPKEIIFEHTKLNVDIYIPPLRQCVNCGRLGHTKLGCKSKKRCLQCGKIECNNNECETNSCILCGRNGHSAKDKDRCPHWEKEMSVNRIKTVKKLTRKEVLDTYFPKNSNRFDILENEDVNFPPMTKENCFVDTTEHINRNFTKRKYSYRVKNGREREFQKKSDNHIVQTKPKTTPNPVYNSLAYQKNMVTQFERLIAEILKITQNLTIENSDSSSFQQIQQLKNQFERILVRRDELEIKESLISPDKP
ncbi:PREDICTED: uncharacterized protein LOC108360583 [Rhagoletis zephyria]|uniref:uncharacterized protein LOC108360583 n=1 Tax=Rhagoletis zephyria TaxID=28612 RepID=UPI00081144E2|nr:PREDICTED: uncharacterized protein LOC108360583 [Rhagoletis zephyria]